MPISSFPSHAHTLRQLQYAVAVAETGGFGRAARACAVSQPSLSAQVAKLEAALGLVLFERHARTVHLTQAGRELIPRMRACLLAARELEDAAQRLRDPASAVLRVGVIPTIAPYLLPGTTERLRTRPDAPRIQWQELTTAACEAALGDGAVDAVLIADPPTLPGTAHLEVGFEPFALLVGADSPLTGPIAPGAAASLDLLLLEEGHCLRDHTLAFCATDGDRSAFQGTSLGTLVQMVATDQGVSVVPVTAVPVETGRARVRALRFAEPVPGRTLVLAWRVRSPHEDAVRALAADFRAALAAGVARAGA